MAKLLAALAIAAATQLPVAWIFMVLVGIVHAQWLTALPTIGYPTTVLIFFVMAASMLVRAIAAAIIKNLAGTDKTPKTVTMRRHNPAPAANTQRAYWMNDSRRHRGLL